jgi:hypothetical protein
MSQIPRMEVLQRLFSQQMDKWFSRISWLIQFYLFDNRHPNVGWFDDCCQPFPEDSDGDGLFRLVAISMSPLET